MTLLLIKVSQNESDHPAGQDNMVMVAGEITTQAKLDYEKVQNLRDSSYPLVPLV